MASPTAVKLSRFDLMILLDLFAQLEEQGVEFGTLTNKLKKRLKKELSRR